MADHVYFPQPTPGTRVIETGGARWWRKGDLIFNQAYAELVTGDHIRDGPRCSLELAAGRRIPTVSEAGPLSGATREARELLAGPAGAEALAIAVLVASPVARVVINVFMRLMSPRIPVRLFGDVAAARAWALEQPHG